jgi:3',5'-cyclic AMP phosphodiesterase CpdA
MRLLHFSDVHVPPDLRRVPFSDWFSKRLVGAFNLAVLRGRRFPRVRHKLERLAEFARQEDVDLALGTGDFTILGTDLELEEARWRVQPFADLPRGLVVVPGNHDRYAPDTVREERFKRHFGDLLTSDLPERAVDGPWPLVRLPARDVAVIALDSAVAHRKPWHAWGRVSDRQVLALESLLGDAALRDRFVFVLVHHAPRLVDGQPDGSNHGLRDADILLNACVSMRRGAILFGHVHRCYRVEVPGLEAALFGAGSTTMLGAEGGWMFDIEDGRGTATRVRFKGGRYALDPHERYDV